jgi:hypothetical protein
MTDTPPDWTQWIIYSLAAVVSTMFTTVVFLTKFIGNRYVEEITKYLQDNADLKKIMVEDRQQHKQEIAALLAKHQECIDGHHKADLRIAALEAQVRSNTKSIKDIT